MRFAPVRSGFAPEKGRTGGTQIDGPQFLHLGYTNYWDHGFTQLKRPAYSGSCVPNDTIRCERVMAGYTFSGYTGKPLGGPACSRSPWCLRDDRRGSELGKVERNLSASRQSSVCESSEAIIQDVRLGGAKLPSVKIREARCIHQKSRRTISQGFSALAVVSAVCEHCCTLRRSSCSLIQSSRSQGQWIAR